jgi:hypothetical protein
MRIAILAVPFCFLAAPAAAQQPGVPVPEAAAEAAGRPTLDPRINQLIIYGDDPCPQSSNDEIIVCARLPDSERYRVPESVRDNPNDPQSRSWADRALELSYVGRTGTDSCSTSGPGGFTGCFNQIVSQARAERAGRDDGQVRAEPAGDVGRVAEALPQMLDCICERLALRGDLAPDRLGRPAVGGREIASRGHLPSVPPWSASLRESPARVPAASRA